MSSSAADDGLCAALIVRRQGLSPVIRRCMHKALSGLPFCQVHIHSPSKKHKAFSVLATKHITEIFAREWAEKTGQEVDVYAYQPSPFLVLQYRMMPSGKRVNNPECGRKEEKTTLHKTVHKRTTKPRHIYSAKTDKLRARLQQIIKELDEVKSKSLSSDSESITLAGSTSLLLQDMVDHPMRSTSISSRV